MLKQKLGTIGTDAARLSILLYCIAKIDVIDLDSVLNVNVKLVLDDTHANYS